MSVPRNAAILRASESLEPHLDEIEWVADEDTSGTSKPTGEELVEV